MNDCCVMCGRLRFFFPATSRLGGRVMRCVARWGLRALRIGEASHPGPIPMWRVFFSALAVAAAAVGGAPVVNVRLVPSETRLTEVSAKIAESSSGFACTRSLFRCEAEEIEIRCACASVLELMCKFNVRLCCRK